jgi:hypothetical protein
MGMKGIGMESPILFPSLDVHDVLTLLVLQQTLVYGRTLSLIFAPRDFVVLHLPLRRITPAFPQTLSINRQDLVSSRDIVPSSSVLATALVSEFHKSHMTTSRMLQRRSQF